MTNSAKPKEDLLSRSALAERLDISLKELTQLMIESGWIVQEGKNWQLTAKGEFEGGQYRDSKKYGQYIVWPATVVDHPMIREMRANSVPVSSLAKQAGQPARLLNRILSDLGWIKTFGKGWQLSEQGRQQGGVQAHDENSGIPYVLWPRNLLENKNCQQALLCLSTKAPLKSLNGMLTVSTFHSQIASWLYLMGLCFRYQSQLFTTEQRVITPDFYLPEVQLCLDFCPESSTAEELSQQLLKAEQLQAEQISHIELKQGEMAELDQHLSRLLIQHGITVY